MPERVCLCVATHRPSHAGHLQTHHVRPRAWGGPSTPDNLADICGTTHDCIHAILDEVVRRKAWPDATFLRRFNRYAVALANRGLVAYLSAHGGAWPTIYTLEVPA